jgi:hypothetical protein
MRIFALDMGVEPPTYRISPHESSMFVCANPSVPVDRTALEANMEDIGLTVMVNTINIATGCDWGKFHVAPYLALISSNAYRDHGLWSNA